MGESLPADEGDAAFIPALCDQLDDVYRRYVRANRAAIEDETRDALEHSRQLLMTAEPGVKEVWLQARMARAIRQTSEILATYATPEEAGATATGPGPVTEQPLAGPPVVAAAEPGTRQGRRLVVGVLATALVVAVAAAVVFYAQLHSTRHDESAARHQAADAQQALTGIQARLASATSDASNSRAQLNSIQAQMVRLRRELSQAQSQLATTSRQLARSTSAPSVPSQTSATGQQLAAAQAQIEHQNAVIQALVVCANDDSVVINDEFAGDTVAAGQALGVANSVCQSASGG